MVAFNSMLRYNIYCIIMRRCEMNISVGEKLVMKKKHPCGCDTFSVLRVGMDFRIRCDGCGREVMLPRVKVEKGIKKVIGENKECLIN